MYRVTVSAAALLLAAAVQPAIADDRRCVEMGQATKRSPDAVACSRSIRKMLPPTPAAASPTALRDYDQAIADYDQAIRLDPKYPFAYNGRGNAYYRKRDYDRAISDYDQAIRLDPKCAVYLRHHV